jgi:hypothetical protein
MRSRTRVTRLAATAPRSPISQRGADDEVSYALREQQVGVGDQVRFAQVDAVQERREYEEEDTERVVPESGDLREAIPTNIDRRTTAGTWRGAHVAVLSEDEYRVDLLGPRNAVYQ